MKDILSSMGKQAGWLPVPLFPASINRYVASTALGVCLASATALAQPSVVEVTADNYSSSVPTTLNIWYNEMVVSPSSTNLANYTLNNAPGVTITNSDVLGTYGLGVILSLSGPVPTNATLTISGVQDGYGATISTVTVPVYDRLTSAQLVADHYHTPDSRSSCFANATDGITGNPNNNASGFDTWPGSVSSCFVGMIYPASEDFRVIKVDLGFQFGDGGSWAAQPNVYILTNLVDTSTADPSSNTNWVQVTGVLISGSQFYPDIPQTGSSADTPIVFDLSSLPVEQRTGYGWAVGGVGGSGGAHFLSISEARAYGYAGAGSGNPITITTQPTNATVVEGNVATFFAKATSIFNLSQQWRENGTNIPGATDINLNIPITTMADSNALIDVVYTSAGVTSTSQVATLTVLPRTTPPVVLDAGITQLSTNAIDFFYTIDVWFDEITDPASATNGGNYLLNDPALSIATVVQGARGHLASLQLNGVPSISNLTVRVSNVQDPYGHTIVQQTVPVQQRLSATNVVANRYHTGLNVNSRTDCFGLATDYIVTYQSGTYEFDTYGSSANSTDFAGLIYGQAEIFSLVKVDLGVQWGDGGDWALQPKLYILTNNVDDGTSTAATRPEVSTNWVQVPATMISGGAFDYNVDGPGGGPITNSPIAFDLSKLPLNQRAGYGWAVGGVQGNGPTQFVSIGELGAYGLDAISQPVSLTIAVSNGNVVISWLNWDPNYVLQSTAALGPSASWAPVGIAPTTQGIQNTVTIPLSTSPTFFRLAR